MGFKSGMKVAFSRLDFSTTVQETLQYIHALHTYILCKKWSNVLESFFTAALMYKKQSVRIPFISYCFTSLLARKLSLHVLAGPGIKQGSVHRLNILNMQVQVISFIIMYLKSWSAVSDQNAGFTNDDCKHKRVKSTCVDDNTSLVVN